MEAKHIGIIIYFCDKIKQLVNTVIKKLFLNIIIKKFWRKFMTKKIIPLFLVFCLMSSTCFAFSENYTWTTLDGTLETSLQQMI